MTMFTVITATLNALPLLKRTADSIFRQSFSDWQWIVIDGASIDGTAEWLKVASDSQDGRVFYICEPDQGIYDALNKAVARVRGQWVLFLGAGDSLYERDTLERCLPYLRGCPRQFSLVYGAVLTIQDIADTDGEVFDRPWLGTRGPWESGRPAMPCHQGVFHRAEIFLSGFRFNPRWSLAADGELLLGELLAGRGLHIDVVVSRMLWGGTSTRRDNRLRLIVEVLQINRALGIFWSRPMLQLILLGSHLVRRGLKILTRGRIQS